MDLVMNKFVSEGVFIVPGNAFSCDPSKPDHHLRFSFSYASPEDIDKVNLKFIDSDLCLAHNAYIYIYIYTYIHV